MEDAFEFAGELPITGAAAPSSGAPGVPLAVSVDEIPVGALFALELFADAPDAVAAALLASDAIDVADECIDAELGCIDAELGAFEVADETEPPVVAATTLSTGDRNPAADALWESSIAIARNAHANTAMKKPRTRTVVKRRRATAVRSRSSEVEADVADAVPRGLPLKPGMGPKVG